MIDKNDFYDSDPDDVVVPEIIVSKSRVSNPDDTDISSIALSVKKPGPSAVAATQGTTSVSHSAEIVTSLYSFTFTQTTGSLLKTRLKAMLRSMNAHSPSTPRLPSSSTFESSFSATPPLSSLNSYENIDMSISELLRHVCNSSQPDKSCNNLQKKPDRALLELLTEPYLDTVPVTISRPSRPPTMFRRASSMIFGKSSDDLVKFIRPKCPSRVNSHPADLIPAGPSMPVLSSAGSATWYRPANGSDPNGSDVYHRGIATPLQHLPSKQSHKQAQFTTSSEYPYAIRTVNDIACVYFGMSKKDAQSGHFADFIPQEFRKWMSDRLDCPSADRVRLSGQLIETNSTLISLWVERSGPDALVWIAEEIQSYEDIIECSRYDYKKKFQTTDHIYRINSTASTVILQGNGHLWAPPVVGCAVLVSPVTLQTIDYNQAVMDLLLGTERDLRGEPFSNLVPQFADFWPHIKRDCVSATGSPIPGLVIPEHKFRALAGIPIEGAAFTAVNPSHDRTRSIRLHTEFGVLYIDLHLRVVDSELMSVWISYSRELSDHVSLQIDGSRTPPLSAVTPPPTPLPSPPLRPSSPRYEEDYSDLLNVQFGSHRRDTQFESFEELKLLGKGGYGEVRLVLTPSKKHKVVLKSIYKDKILVDTWSRDRLLGIIPNEIRVLNQLRASHHPHIVEAVDFFEDARCYHVEMIPCMGPGVMDLFDFIETRGDSVTFKHLIRIWEQVVSAVAHIHSLGIVHRDLKDENVIMDSRGSATLIDFGSSAYINQGPFDVFVGTIDYAAPEVVEGRLYEGVAQDNWALGIMLYTIIMREPPFKSADEIVAAQYPKIPHVQDKEFKLCDKLIRLLLAKLPEERPTASEILDMVEKEKI